MNKSASWILAITALALLSGCAVRVFEVTLSVPPAANAATAVSVRDGRVDPQVYVTAISISGTNVHLLAANPPLSVALERHLGSAVESTFAQVLSKSNFEVSIEELELRNRVGFGKADHLTCRIESNLAVPGSGLRDLRRVKTLAMNDQNMSPLIAISAKVILDQCLREHAKDLAVVVGGP